MEVGGASPSSGSGLSLPVVKPGLEADKGIVEDAALPFFCVAAERQFSGIG